MWRLGACNTVKYTAPFEFPVFWLAVFSKVGMNRDIAASPTGFSHSFFSERKERLGDWERHSLRPSSSLVNNYTFYFCAGDWGRGRRYCVLFPATINFDTSSNCLILFLLFFRAHCWNQSKYKHIDRLLVQGNSHANDLHCETKWLWKGAVTCELRTGGCLKPLTGVKPRQNDRNTLTQHIVTLLGATC